MKNRNTKERLTGIYLLLVFLILSVGIVTIGFLYYRNYEQQYRTQVEQHLSAIAKLKVGELVQWRGERLADAAALHKNTAFSDLVERYLKNPGDMLAKEYVETWLRLIQVPNQYHRVFLLDDQGMERMSVPENAQPAASHLAQDARETTESGEVRFLDFHRDDEGRHIHLAVLVPILGGHSGDRRLGTLVLRIDPEQYLYPFISRWPTESRTAETLLIRREGNDALFLNELRFQKNTALNRRIPLTTKDNPAAVAASGQERIVEGPDYRGVQVVAAVRGVPDSPWFLVARMDAEEVYGPLRERLWVVIILAGVLLVGSGAVVALVWRHQSARFYQDRYEAAVAMNALSERHNAILGAIPDIIMEVNADKVYTWANQAGIQFFGEDVIGKKADFYFEGEQDTYQMVQPLFDGREEVFYVESWQRRRDGQSRLLAWWCRVLKDEKGNVRGALSSARDITEAKQAEQDLLDSLKREQFLAHIIRSASVAVGVGYPDGKMGTCNKAFQDLTGYSEDELRSIQWNTILTPPEWAQHEAAQLEEINRTRKPIQYEKEYVHKNGRKIPIELVVHPLMDDTGQVSHYFAFVTDITERKRAEQRIEHLNRVLRSIREVNQLIVHENNPDRLIREACKLLVDHQGYGSALIIITDEAGVPRSFAEAGSDAVFKPLAEKLNRGELPDCCADARLHEGVLVVVDRSRICGACPLTASCLSNDSMCVRLRHEEHTHGYLAVAVPRGIASDGEERSLFAELAGDIAFALRNIELAEQSTRSSEALRQSEERYRSLVESIHDVIYEIDGQGVITYISPVVRNGLGYEPEEVVGRALEELVYPEDRWLATNWFEDLVRGVEHPAEYRMIGKSGDIRWVRTLAKPAMHSETFPGARGTLTDITEHRELSRQLQQAQKMEAVGTLAGGIAHDFNNLLQSVLGYSELVLADNGLPDRFRDDLEKILASGRSGADLVQRLLTFSRKTETKPLELDLNERIRQTRKFLERTIPKMIDIELILAENLAGVLADPTQMDQVIMNLAINARDAMTEGGKLLIETANVLLDNNYAKSHLEATSGRYVLLQVSDTGSGMDKETLDRIFEPFFTTKGPGEGTGLGLAMVYGIVQQHQGFINCYSEVGHGSTFRIYLPAIISEPKSDQPVVIAMPQGGTETILLVDDEELIRDLGKRILCKAGYKVLTASNGQEALDRYRKEQGRIDLVILDLIMPEMGGKGCLEALLGINPNIIVLIASGFSPEGPMKGASANGSKAFVAKPFDMRQLLQTVRGALDSE